MKVAVLYFPASNEVTIVSMIFASLEDGLKEVERLTGLKMEWNEKGKEYRLNLYDFINNETEQWVDDDASHARKFFTSYYGGCGEAGWAALKEVEYGKPLFAFNLD